MLLRFLSSLESKLKKGCTYDFPDTTKDPATDTMAKVLVEQTESDTDQRSPPEFWTP